MEYITTIGLEIHAELKTERKMFCDCLNDDKEIEPNKNVCPVCLGHPGALPKANKKAIDFVIKTGLALNCSINKNSKFDRKNYFYPDLPKAYQISQYDMPLCENGRIILPNTKKEALITRIHLEEDTARLAHTDKKKDYSLVDFNRSGVPLMELVTEPCFSNADDAVEFAKEFQLILRYIGVSDADMESGGMRVEANISVAKKGAKELGTKVEVKNLNSFKAVYGAIKYEVERQVKEINNGKKIIQETRGWDEKSSSTVSQRIKENAHDYRYFPEPDLPPMYFEDNYIEQIKNSIVELPSQKRERMSVEYNLSETKVGVLIENKSMCDFFEESVSELNSFDNNGNSELIFNYLTSDVRGLEGEFDTSVFSSKLTPHMLAHIVFLLQNNKISSRAGKYVLKEVFLNGRNVEDVIKENDLYQVSDGGEIDKIVSDIIEENKKVWDDYKNGNDNTMQFLIGKVMEKTKGKADPAIVSKIIREKK